MNLPEIVLNRYKLLQNFRQTVWNDLSDSNFNQEWFVKRPPEFEQKDENVNYG